MAAIVTGLIPILRTAVDATASYKCRSVWFGLLCIRLVTLFLAELPFAKLDADFTCNGTGDDGRQCFNKHFHKPVVMAWNFIFVLVVLTVLLMELFTSHLLSAAQKRRSRTAVDVELQGREETRVVAPDPNVRPFIDLHKDRGALCFYLLSVFLRVATEAWFVYVLLSWNLPALNSGPYKCSPGIFCVVRAAPEKRMSIYALSSLSGVIIVCSVLFCAYAVAHYLCLF